MVRVWVQEHWRMGQAISKLRDEGVLLFGSGMSFHNMRGFMRGSGGVSAAFAASQVLWNLPKFNSF